MGIIICFLIISTIIIFILKDIRFVYSKTIRKLDSILYIEKKIIYAIKKIKNSKWNTYPNFKNWIEKVTDNYKNEGWNFLKFIKISLEFVIIFVVIFVWIICLFLFGLEMSFFIMSYNPIGAVVFIFISILFFVLLIRAFFTLSKVKKIFISPLLIFMMLIQIFATKIFWDEFNLRAESTLLIQSNQNIENGELEISLGNKDTIKLKINSENKVIIENKDYEIKNIELGKNNSVKIETQNGETEDGKIVILNEKNCKIVPKEGGEIPVYGKLIKLKDGYIFIDNSASWRVKSNKDIVIRKDNRTYIEGLIGIFLYNIFSVIRILWFDLESYLDENILKKIIYGKNNIYKAILKILGVLGITGALVDFIKIIFIKFLYL